MGFDARIGGQKNAPLSPVVGTLPPPRAQTFDNPMQASGWTGVSSDADPYGLHNIGFDAGTLNDGSKDMNGKPTGVVGRDILLGASGNGHNIGPGGTPLFSGFSKYENQNAPDGSSLGSDASQTQAQTTNAQNNLSQYPAYGNQYGLGGQISPPSSTGIATAPSNPAQADYSGQGVTVNVPDTSSRGFNPWSIQGESNARDTTKGVSI